MSSLKKLQLLFAVTNAGMASLSSISDLEALRIQRSSISDEGLAYLKPMRSLKEIVLQMGGPRDPSSSSLTDTGLAHLSQIKSLESIKLYQPDFTDRGLKHLSELDKLRCLVIPNSSNFTDQGFSHLAKLQSLEELYIGCHGVTDAGINHIAGLTSLKDLTLFNADSMTNKGLAKLTSLKSLNRLSLWAPRVTISGLNQLNVLANLTELDARGTGYPKYIAHDDSVLHLDQLTKLERLAFPAVRNDDLACLARFPHLKRLEINNRGTVSNAAMVYLRGLTGLNRLRLYGMRLTDEGLANLVNMKNLDHLTISGDFTDNGLRRLEDLKGLRYLHIVCENAPNPATLQRLQEKLPNLSPIQTEIRKFPEVTQLRLRVGKPLPSFENISLKFSSESAEGKNILLCFWDMEQRPSRRCIKKLAKMSDDLAKKGVVVISVHTSTVESQKLKRWMKESKIGFAKGQVPADAVQKTLAAWGVRSLPWLILTDQKHVVQAEGFPLAELQDKLKGTSESP